MRAIFYDLETSDRDFVGQILSFSFIAVSESFEVEAEFSGTIALTPLQAPSLGALLTNRIRVLDHKGSYTERQAAVEIAKFLERCTAGQKAIALIGYNNFRFDLQFLRTVLIRNGINPYNLGVPVVHRDLYALVQFLAASDSRFVFPTDSEGRRSLSLENVSRQLGVLKGLQTHDARDDVLLEIELARALHTRFGAHVTKFDPYQLPQPGRVPRAALARGALYLELSPNRENDSSRARLRPYLLVDSDAKNSLWCDLSDVTESPKSIRYRKSGSGLLFLLPYEACSLTQVDALVSVPGREGPSRVTFEELDSAVQRIAPDITARFQAVNLKNFFDREPECDIEQFIYRLDSAYILRLHRALFEGDERGVREAQDRDLSVLLTRAKLASADFSDHSVLAKLQAYGAYRYGGKMLLSRFKDDPEARYSVTREQLVSEASAVVPDESPDDREIRMQLFHYYQQAPVLQGW